MTRSSNSPNIGMFYGIGLNQARPQSFVFLSEHAEVFKTNLPEDMFAQTFGMIGQTLCVGAVGTILLAMALVGYKKAKTGQSDADIEASENYRVEAA